MSTAACQAGTRRDARGVRISFLGANRPPRLQWSTPPSGTSAPIN